MAMTISATAQANKPIQLAEDGQANPEESLRIRKTLADLPAVSSEKCCGFSQAGCICAARHACWMDQR